MSGFPDANTYLAAGSPAYPPATGGFTSPMYGQPPPPQQPQPQPSGYGAMPPPPPAAGGYGAMHQGMMPAAGGMMTGMPTGAYGTGAPPPPPPAPAGPAAFGAGGLPPAAWGAAPPPPPPPVGGMPLGPSSGIALAPSHMPAATSIPAMGQNMPQPPTGPMTYTPGVGYSSMPPAPPPLSQQLGAQAPPGPPPGPMPANAQFNPAGAIPPPQQPAQPQHLQDGTMGAGSPVTEQNLRQANASFGRTPSDAAVSRRTPPPQQPITTQMRGPVTTNPGATRARAKPQGTNRIDSAQVPSPCRDLMVEGNPAYQAPATAVQTTRPIPALAASNFPSLDDGNAAPKFLRATVHAAPHDDVMLRESGLPWSLAMSPLCDRFQPGEARVPLEQRRTPVRCVRCRAYMNPWCSFSSNGRTWACSFCAMSNDVTAEYFAPVDGSRRRVDAAERSELSKGSYEFDVTGFADYEHKNPETGAIVAPQPMHHLFLIDVSAAAKTSLPTVAQCLHQAIKRMARMYPECKVSFVTYASTLHFYNFSDPSVPQMVVPDVESPFVPLPFNILCWIPLDEGLETIYSFLDRLPEIQEVADETGCACGAAARVATMILSDIGGKVIMTATSHPTEGLGRYPLREQNHVYGTDKEQALFKPPSGFWPTAAVEAAKRQISFDLLLLPTGYADVVTMGQLCHLTNGQQAVFFNFTADNDTQRLTDFFGRSLLEEAGYAAILRVRCSAGIKVQGYHGHFMQTDPQDMDLACVQGSSTFLADLAHEGRLDKKGTALVQCALLYTSRRGGRRVRVHTLRMNVAEQYSTLYRHTDLEATTYSIICHGVHEAVNKGVKPAREYLQRRVADLLVGYRRHSNSSTNSGQLLLPEQLKLLPVYIMCTLKSDAFVQGTAVRLDDRMQNMFLLLGYPLDRLLYYLYPRLYPLHALAGNTGLAKYPGSALPVVMPPVLQLTADSVYVNGIYALVDMQANILFLWVGSQVPPKTLQQVFGTENPLEVNGSAENMARWDEKVRSIIQQLLLEGGRLVVVREKRDGGIEDAFFRMLLEDENVPGLVSYSENLCALHKTINTRVNS